MANIARPWGEAIISQLRGCRVPRVCLPCRSTPRRFPEIFFCSQELLFCVCIIFRENSSFRRIGRPRTTALRCCRRRRRLWFASRRGGHDAIRDADECRASSGRCAQCETELAQDIKSALVPPPNQISAVTLPPPSRCSDT